MANALLNFFNCFSNHPQYNSQGKVFIGYTKFYEQLVHRICYAFNAQNPELTIIVLNTEESTVEAIVEQLNLSDLFILFYDSNYTQTLGRPQVITQILPFLKQFWKKSCVFKDYGEHFAEAFGVQPRAQYLFNERLIDLAGKSKQLIYKDDRGSCLVAEIEQVKWQNISGMGNLDLVPGEIATYADISGTINFTGAFLSVIPFAPKYGIINTPLTLSIKNNQIIKLMSTNLNLLDDMKKYISFNQSNSRVEELGVGTNSAVKNLYGINAGFEERHIGLHLGLGGAVSGSDHLDLICKNGSIYFDDTLIIKNETIVFK